MFQCFNGSLINAVEDQGSVLVSIYLTNPASFDITIPIVATNETATGKVTSTTKF